MSRFIKVLSLIILVMLLSSAGISSSNPTSELDQNSTQGIVSEAYLELSLDSAETPLGTMITLNITYHNIGLPYTNIKVEPADILAFEPPLSMPCKYDQHPNGCTAITFMTLATGEVTFTASATGELFGEECQCWYWGGASDNGAVSATIVDPAMRLFMPFVQH